MEQPRASAQTSAEDRQASLATFLSRLFSDAESLLLQELALFRAELGENAGRLLSGALLALAGVLVVLIGMLGLVAALTIMLSGIIPLWLACALVGLAVGAVGALLLLYARRLMQSASFVPARTLQSLRETRDWMHAELT
jgi:uncharacterized membrane protein YqjE